MVMLYIKNNRFDYQEIDLKTVQPFVFKTFDLEDPAELVRKNIYNASEHALKAVNKEIERIIAEIRAHRAANKLSDMMPLIRLVVYYHE